MTSITSAASGSGFSLRASGNGPSSWVWAAYARIGSSGHGAAEHGPFGSAGRQPRGAQPACAGAAMARTSASNAPTSSISSWRSFSRTRRRSSSVTGSESPQRRLNWAAAS